MQELPPGVVPGALVHARGAQWRVRQTRTGETASLVTLEGLEPADAGRVSTLLVPVDCIRPVLDRAPVRRRRPRVVTSMLHAIACARPAAGLWCAAGARIDIWPWQLAPALAVLGEGATRLLLADAVGLGKTVQAGLVLAELRARGLVDRAMVLAPAAVRAQWADELRSRFALAAHILDVPALLELGQRGHAGVNPWGCAPIVVSSIDLVKRAEIRAAVEQAPIDLLIVDEAHHATPGTDRHAVVSRLARQAAWVLLVSATPHSGDAPAYEALLAIGDTPRGTPIRVFRRSTSDVSALVPRRTHVWHVQPSGPEAHLQAGVLAYARRMCRLAPSGAGATLFAALLARRAASSARAARLTLERRLAWLNGEATPESARPQPLPWEELEPEEGDASWLTIAGLPDQQAERLALSDLIERAKAAEHDPSKIVRLLRFVRRTDEAAIVFSEFRDTLEACREALDPVVPVALLHGELDAAERQQRLAGFVEGRTRVLLTTDVAGEGLNLHHAARLVVMLEWPWSPLRLEQRIGRVHRLGQRRMVHAVHLTAASSYEEVVVAHVRQRAARAEAALRVTDAEVERRVTALVLDLPLAPEGAGGRESEGCEPRSVDARAVHEAERVERARALARLTAGEVVDAAWALPRRRGWSARVVILVEVVQQRPSGGIRRTCFVPVAVTLPQRVRGVRSWRACAARLARDPRVHDAATAAAAPDGEADQWIAVRNRLDALWSAGGLRRAPPRVQPSLFDRRAVRAAEHRQQVEAARGRWRDGIRSRLADAPVRVSTRAVAVLPLGEARE
jgi:superfamily II DNA or RNA helicase